MFATVRWVDPLTKEATLSIGFYTDYEGFCIVRNNLPITRDGDIVEDFLDTSEGTVIPHACIIHVEGLHETPVLMVLEGGKK